MTCGKWDTYGREIAFAYDGQNRLVGITDPLGRTTTLAYDPTGRQLLGITDPGNHTTSFGYNFLYQLTSKQDQAGRSFTYAYAQGKPVGIRDSAGTFLVRMTNPVNWAIDAITLARDQRRQYVPSATTVTDGRGNQWTYSYDANGHITAIAAPDGATTAFAYDPSTLQVASITDANTYTTTYTYDGLGNRTRIEDARGNLTKFEYEPQFSQVIRAEDPNGRVTRYEYDTRGNRLREIDPVGEAAEWTYDEHGNVGTQTDRRGVVTDHDYDSFGNRTRTVVDVAGLSVTTTFTHDATGNLLSRTDDNLHTRTYEYDGLDRVVRETDAIGCTLQRDYNGEGERSRTVDCKNRVTQYAYDRRGRLVRIVDPAGKATRYAYDGYNNRTSVTDRLTRPTELTYTVRNRLERIIDPLHHAISFEYDAVGNVIAETDANGSRTEYRYDELNRRILIFHPAPNLDGTAAVTRFEYDGVGGCPECTGPRIGSPLVSKQTDPNGKVTYFKYDALDRLIAIVRKVGDTADVIDATDAVERFAYDPNGNRTTALDPNLNPTTYRYDTLNRRIEMKNGAGDTTITEYDGVGNVVRVIEPNGNVVTYEYDARDRLTIQRDTVGLVGTYAYDEVGNRTSKTDGNANTTRYRYDVLDRIVAVTDPRGHDTRFAYDAEGHLLRITDRKNRVTAHAYDAAYRLVRTTDALTNVTHFEYDNAGNLTGIEDPNGHRTTYAYDGAHRRTRETHADPVPNSRTFVYDGVGLLRARTDQKGQTTTYDYDDLSFLTIRHYPSRSETFKHDAGGRVREASRPGWAVTFEYDGGDRILRATQGGHTIEYSYDIPGRLRTIAYPGGRTVLEETDLRMRPSSLAEAGGSATIARYTYDAGDRVVTREHANGTAATYAYDPNDQVRTLEHASGARRVVGFAYTYDTEDNRLSEKKTHELRRSEAYSYDSTNRLLTFRVGTLVGSKVAVPLTQTQYTLDAVGNWTQVTDGVPETRTHNEVNELTAIDGSPLAHDANGNLLDDGVMLYEYDEEKRLTRATRKADGHIVGEYRYDALGRRVEKIVDPAGAPMVTRYFYDRARALEEQDQFGATEATYVYGRYLDEVLTMDRGGQTYHYHQNARYSPTALTNGMGDIVEAYRYDAYGVPTVLVGPGPDGVWFTGDEPEADASAIGNPYLYTGQRLDPETGVMYFKNRYFSPRLGRFLTRDPIGYANGWSLYAADFGMMGGLDPLGFELRIGGQTVKKDSELAKEVAARGAVAKEIIDTMIGSKHVYDGYKTKEDFLNEVKFRELLVQAARDLDKAGHKFPDRDHPLGCCWCQYWQKEDGGGIRVKDGKSPSAALDELFTSQKKSKGKKRTKGPEFGFECASAQQLIWLKAMRDFMGGEAFDKWAGKFTSPLGVSASRSPSHPYKESLGRDPLPGDGISFVNPQGLAGAQNENSLYLGGGQYYGHGYGIRDAAGMIDGLNGDRIPGATKPASIRDGSMRPGMPPPGMVKAP